VVKKKTGGGGNSTTTAGKTSITEPTEETTYTLPTNNSPLGTTGGETVANNDFKYPSEWDQAGDVWSQMASGNYSNTGMDWLKNMMSSGGNAFDVSGYDKANQPAMMDQFSNMVKQMAEQAGVGGARYGSGLQNAIGNYGGQLQNQYNQNKYQNAFNAYEAGQGRASNAGNWLSQLGLGAQQTGAEGLLGLGQNRAQLPLQVASYMSGTGNQLNSQDAMWAQLLGQLTGNNYAQPQTYTKSGFQNVLGSLSQTLPSALSSWDDKGWWS